MKLKLKIVTKIYKKVKSGVKSIKTFLKTKEESSKDRYIICEEKLTVGETDIIFLQDKYTQKQYVRKDCKIKMLLKNEIKILKLIGKNERIIDVIDIFKSDIGRSIIFERAHGDLFDEVLENGPITLGPGLNILLQLFDGLQFLHGKSIIHRDIKLENIVFFKSQDRIERIKIIDFGLATVYKKNKNITDQAGTFGYLAPEVINEMPQTFAVDLWSAGVVICIMYCCHNPFDPDKYSEYETMRIAADLCNDKIIMSIRESYIVNVIRSLLQIDPDLRPPARDWIPDLISYSKSFDFLILQFETFQKGNNK